jgi:anti-sigma factor RsiW
MSNIVHRMLGPEGPELGCEECFAELDRYVDLRVSGAAADERVPGMAAHLAGCPACAEEYASLRELVALDR